MSSELIAALIILALIDSTSFGTLLIPVWLMLTPGRLRPGRIVLFLATVAVFYLVLGIALLAGSAALVDAFSEIGRTIPFLWGQVVLGAGLIVFGIVSEPWTKVGKAKKAARRKERERLHGPGRIARLRQRASDGAAPIGAVLGLALAAAAIEAASMLPYLGAIGILATSALTFASGIVVLVAYCLVMIVPALLLLAARVLLHDRISGSLARLEGWLSRSSGEAIAWVAVLGGLYLLGGALTAFGFA